MILILILWALSVLFGVVALGFFVALLSSEKGRRSFVLALRSLWLHKLRSGLSVLGIFIGTGAVVVLMAFGEGNMQDALNAILRLGATNIMVRSVKPPDDSSSQQQRGRAAIYGLTYDDFDRFGTIGTIIRRVPMRIFTQEIRNRDRYLTGRTVATTPEYAVINKLDMAAGRFLTEDDDHQMANVCVLAANTADRLFPFDNPVGESVRIGPKYLYRVVGVIKERMPTGGSGGSQAAEDFNNDVYIPLNTCKVRFGERIVFRQPGSMTAEQVQLSQVTLSVGDMNEVKPAADVIKDLIERYHNRPDTAVTVPLDILKAAEETRNRGIVLSAGIAAVTLLVGGIGIMNIMLATVTERTREIGIRRALGAKRRDIVMQFLSEAVVQTAVGGLAGVLLGLGAVLGVPPLVGWLFHYNVPLKVNDLSIFLSLSVSIVVGIAFGLYPSWRAARLDPIEALRHE
jgi:putative ABC transport system permease protein